MEVSSSVSSFSGSWREFRESWLLQRMRRLLALDLVREEVSEEFICLSFVEDFFSMISALSS